MQEIALQNDLLNNEISHYSYNAKSVATAYCNQRILLLSCGFHSTTLHSHKTPIILKIF